MQIDPAFASQVTLKSRSIETVPQDRGSVGSTILEQLNAWISDFPPLSTNTLRILDELRKPVPQPSQLNALAKQDPALTVGLLRVANSAAYAQQQEVTSVDKAVLLLGYDVVLTLAMRGAMAGLTANRNTSGLNQEVLLKHNIATGLFAGALARKFGRIEPDEAVTAGLLHDIGKLVMGIRYPRQMNELLDLKTTRLGESRLGKEERLFGFNHALAGSILASCWQLPATLTLAIELHHHPQLSAVESLSDRDRALTMTVFMANQMAKLAGCAGDDPELDLPGNELSEAFGLSGRYEPLFNELLPKVRAPLSALVEI